MMSAAAISINNIFKFYCVLILITNVPTKYYFRTEGYLLILLLLGCVGGVIFPTVRFNSWDGQILIANATAVLCSTVK